MISLKSGVRIVLMEKMIRVLYKKDFDFNKFIKAFGSKKWITPVGKVINSFQDINVAIEIACLGKLSNFDEDIGSPLFFDYEEYEVDAKKKFKQLDKSFKYIPIMQLFENTEVSNSFQEYAYLNSSKISQSFLTFKSIFNENNSLKALQVFKKLKKNKLKDLSNIILNYHDFNKTECNRIVFNGNFNWDMKKIKKLFIKSAKKRNKLFTMFKGKKETDDRPDEQKKVHLYILNANKVGRDYFFDKSYLGDIPDNYMLRIGKDEHYEYIDISK